MADLCLDRRRRNFQRRVNILDFFQTPVTMVHTILAISSVIVFAGSEPRVSAFSHISSFAGRDSRHYSRSTARQQQISDSISVGVLGEPFFVDEDLSIKNVTAQLGVTTYLHCRVNNLGGKTVSWLKRHGDTPHLLTFGLTTYSSDARFQIFHEQPNDWKLQIQFPTLEDAGIYECLVSTNPPLVRRTRLSVIVPEIEIVDERDKAVSEKSYEGGSTIELKCLVSQIVDEPPEYIIWHHEDRMLNYDTERGGISVKTDLLKNGAISRLSIAFASKSDTGNYTCSMRSAQASVMVHVPNGENMAAMQTGSSIRVMPSLDMFILFIFNVSVVANLFSYLFDCRITQQRPTLR